MGGCGLGGVCDLIISIILITASKELKLVLERHEGGASMLKGGGDNTDTFYVFNC